VSSTNAGAMLNAVGARCRRSQLLGHHRRDAGQNGCGQHAQFRTDDQLRRRHQLARRRGHEHGLGPPASPADPAQLGISSRLSIANQNSQLILKLFNQLKRKSASRALRRLRP